MVILIILYVRVYIQKWLVGCHAYYYFMCILNVIGGRRLAEGDEVWVHLHGSWSSDRSVHCCWSTFSGFLLGDALPDVPGIVG